ncbi:catalase [Immersiella caudata]|uniref:Catalase n=1 Tax=Immersiella caudata TaxID=314043 RepID=A0AA39W4A6_9PEZI|nr:catalase [Immersiella caudata]
MGSTAKTTPIYTLAEGISAPSPPSRPGLRTGLMLLQDIQLIETLAHFNRERIPKRVAHASACGAWGELVVTHDISHLTSAQFLTGIGTKSKTLARISTVGPGRGAADTIRDVRGWSLKVFTEEGNQDFVPNGIPVFFIRDPVKFPSLNRSHERDPATNCTSATIDRGTPKSVRLVNGYSGHTYKLTKDGSFHYVKFHLKSDQGNENSTDEEPARLAGVDPDNHAADLYDHIAKGKFPSWTLYIQLIFNKNAISGIAPSADPILQARMFAYRDTVRYRLDVNYQQLPCNRPVSQVYSPYQCDEFAAINGNYGPDPNYVSSSLHPVAFSSTVRNGANGYLVGGHDVWTMGMVTGYSSEVQNEDFVQARVFWENMLGKQEGQQEAWVETL